ncbi:ATP synthase subunit s, mitochondrial [Lates japonicus]|uniref:ATP synthase subunit s, mitochondrial n=1 Tax=Lates japonicus TaxID=270547 RepID=A0AAD3M5Y5_LATJO|nr:ATP synthase subunit s, mitochondrial [Lates japonicus]
MVRGTNELLTFNPIPAGLYPESRDTQPRSPLPSLRDARTSTRSANGTGRSVLRHKVKVFNKVDYERIKAVGPDRAAAEWLLRCGAKVRFQGFDRWHHDYNGLPTGPLGRYKIHAIDATESCIMYRGFDHLDGLKHVEEIKFNKCIYIEDTCLEKLSSIENLQESVYMMEVVSCGNVTDKGIVSLHKLRNLEYLFLSDLPGIKDRQTTVDRLQTALPRLDLVLDLD